MPSARMIGSMLATLLVALSPLPVLAQTQPVGVVTTLTGQATLARTALPEPLILKFKDDVFERDRISTAEKSIVRVLLGGKAIVTVRELSVVTIIEEPGRATVDLTSGKIGLSVAKQRMRPGESLEIRTPNAVAAVRGTVITVETAMVAGTQVTDYDVQSGTLDLLAPRPEVLSPGRGITVSGLTAGIQRAARPDAFTAGFERESGSGAASTDAATEVAAASGMTQANALALVISPPPSQLAGPVGPIGTVQVPPILSTTGKTDEEIKKTGGTTPVVDTTVPGGGNGGGGNGGGGTGPPPGGPKTNVLINPGFETNALPPNWTLTGAGGVITNLGPIAPPEGQRMAIIHTGAGAVPVSQLPSPLNLAANRPPNAQNGSVLTQSFSVPSGSLFTVQVTYNFLSNEFPTFFAGGNSSVNDTFRARLLDPSGQVLELAQASLNGSFPSGVAPQTATAGGFTISQGNGVTGFSTATKQWVPEGTGTSTLFFDIYNVGDTSVPSAALIDAAAVGQDPPLYFLRRGDSLVRTGADPLLRLTNTTQTFDSLMVVCCDGRASLGGPLLQATDSNLTVPWSVLAVMQGGVLTTSSTDPLARFDGGAHTFGGGGVPMFDLYGTSTATDPETGLTLGTHRPLQHGGSLLEASNATINATQVIRVDSALLEASAPLLSLKNGTRLTTAADTVQLSYQAKVTSLGSVMKLDRSALTVAQGAALNLAGGSVLRVTGDLFSLTNGSSLNLLSGPLVSLSGGSFLNVTGALIGFGGTGGNLVSVTNSFCPCTTIGGIPVSLTGGAVASNVSIAGAIKNSGLGSVNLSPNAALIRVDGAATKVTINGL
jgi:FecR protein